MRQAKSLKAAICFKSPALDSGRSPAIHRGRIQGASGYVNAQDGRGRVIEIEGGHLRVNEETVAPEERIFS